MLRCDNIQGELKIVCGLLKSINILLKILITYIDYDNISAGNPVLKAIIEKAIQCRKDNADDIANVNGGKLFQTFSVLTRL